MNDTDGTWKTVPWKQRKFHRKEKKQCNHVAVNQECYISAKPVQFHLNEISCKIKELCGSTFCAEFLAALHNAFGNERHVKEIVCYALGTPTESKSSAYQLAMLAIIRQFLADIDKLSTMCEIKEFLEYFSKSFLRKKDVVLENVKCSLFDPVFTMQDRKLINDLSMDVLKENEEGRREATDETLFYMIHSDKWITNNLLWKNWSTENLNNLLVVGNSFMSIYERTPSSYLKADYKYLYLVNELDLYSEIQLPVYKYKEEMFNDTSVLWFPAKKLILAEAELRKSYQENCPTYSE
ncbi:uncharacterized protein LOC143459505 [Clavelina lepadiformis]|uniref:uncharacterized protein LOC143459505 n=1 Tax=Clavelina lepadiformis TaxID=159417 RepID=UPI0040426B87